MNKIVSFEADTGSTWEDKIVITYGEHYRGYCNGVGSFIIVSNYSFCFEPTSILKKWNISYFMFCKLSYCASLTLNVYFPHPNFYLCTYGMDHAKNEKGKKGCHNWYRGATTSEMTIATMILALVAKTLCQE